MGSLVRDLEAQGLELLETHISWVFLSPTEVFKIKRPVELGFLDFSTLERRREACESEIRLNGRLASGVYLGLVPVTRDERGQHRLGGKGTPIDWAVRMRRLPDTARADHLLAEGRLGLSQIEQLARRLAAFHAEARCDEETSSFGTVARIRENVRENFAQTRAVIHEYLTETEADGLEAWQLEALEDEEVFNMRIAERCIRDGHGDLRLEHVYFDGPDGLNIIDCIEFNDRFRYADTCSDVAFLSMDLVWHQRADLAEAFLARYAQESNDYGLYAVIDFYESYRAYVRGKVSAILAADEGASSSTRERARLEARRYFVLSLAFERPPLVAPRLIAVGGMIASGKSTVAQRIGELLSGPVLGSDRTRKHSLGHQATDSVQAAPWTGAYSEAQTTEVYRTLERNAQTILDSGRPVVVDASFRSQEMRRRFRDLARQLDVPFAFVECACPSDVTRKRLRARDVSGTHESDARSDLFDEFAMRYEPVQALSDARLVEIDTSAAWTETDEQLIALCSA